LGLPGPGLPKRINYHETGAETPAHRVDRSSKEDLLMARLIQSLHLRWIFATLLPIMLTGCGSTPINGPQAWIDAPLDGSRLALVPQEVIAHGAYPGGISLLELRVNGADPQSETPSDTSAGLAYVKWTWHPPEPGRYTLAVRAQTADGSWSEPSQVMVTIGELATPSPTPTEGPTATPTPTASPTPTDTPTALPAGINGQPPSTGRVFFGGASCDPQQVTFSARARAPGGVKVVVFFYRVEDAASGEQSDWSQGEAMNPQGDGSYSLTKTGDSLARMSGFSGDGGIVHYQFALQPAEGQITRSPVFTDLQLARCNSITILPPITLMTATPTVPVVH
jgi:hypothetical protein